MEELIIYSDGGSRGNPGPAAIGFVLQDKNGKTVYEGCHFLGLSTNNVAEYQALTAALKKAKELSAKKVSCFLDSELVVRQLNGQYKIKDEKMRQSFLKLSSLIKEFEKISFTAVPRDRNKRADELVNRSLDEQAAGTLKPEVSPYLTKLI